MIRDTAAVHTPMIFSVSLEAPDVPASISGKIPPMAAAPVPATRIGREDGSKIASAVVIPIKKCVLPSMCD